MISRGFRFRIYPTPEQEILFGQFAGVCRLVYNLALEQRETWWRQYRKQTGQNISVASQCKELTALRSEIDWIAAVPVNVQQQALRDLDKAFANFFSGRAEYPRHRRKGEYSAFRFPAAHCGALTKINAKWSTIRLPKLGDVRVRTHRPAEGRALSVSISEAAGKWYASFGCEIEREPAPMSARAAVGIDRGVARTLTLSTGKAMSLDREHLQLLDRRARKAQRALSRKKRGSRRAYRAKLLLARVRSKVALYRKDWNHKASFEIANRFGIVVMEKLATKNMTRSARGTLAEPGRNVRQKAGLNRSILGQAWNQFETALSYKLNERGGYLLTVDPRHTSQTCARCGNIDPDNRRSQSKFSCVACGYEANADYNAACVILHRGQSAGVERGVGPASKREAKGRRTRKTVSLDAAQLVPVHMGDSGDPLCSQPLAG